eukprot:jgi/Psemu1/24206/gm1.24206_g
MKSTKPSQSTSIDRSYQSPPPRKKPKAQESQKSKPPITSFRCICNWGNYTYQGMEIPVCEFMFNQFQTHLEDGHPWKNQLIKFTTGTTVKSLAFKAAVFEIFKVSADQKSFRLERHHFSPTLLTNHPGQRTQLLTAQEVHALDNTLVSPEKGYATSKYTVYSLLRNHPMVSFTAQMVEMYKKKYVGSPLLPKKWVLGRAESFSSPRKSRTSDLNAVTSKRPLLPVKRLMPLELLDKKQSGVKTRGKCYKSIESIYAGLISHYKQAKTLEEFQAAEFVQRAMNDISFQARRNSVYPTAFELEKNTILHACMSYPVPIEPHSKVKMSALSPFSQWQRAQGLVHRQKIWTQKVKRMKLDVCEAKEEQMVAINSDEAKSLLQAAFGCIGSQEEKSEFKQSVLEVLMKADKHKNFQDKMDGNEISLFTSRICEMLDAESHKLSGNDKQLIS